MSDLSQIETGDLLGELTGRLATAEAELAGLREQRDLLNGLIKIKAPEVDQLRRLVSSMTPKTRKPKAQPKDGEGISKTGSPVEPEVEVVPANPAEHQPETPQVAPAPAFQPE